MPARLTARSVALEITACWVPETHAAGGPDSEVSIEMLADALLDPHHERDGVTILGGEPFAQPEALYLLVDALRCRKADLHILAYTGYTREALLRRDNPYINAVLGPARVDMLIEGPYVALLAASAGPFTGSSNQRVLTLRDAVQPAPKGGTNK